MSIIQAAGSGEVTTGFYKILLDQSLKFNDGDNPFLKRTPASQGSLTTFTFSFWYKRCVFGSYQEVFHVYPGSGERSQILFMTDDTLKVELEAGNTNHFITNRLFRDPSAWYNVVVAFDSTNGTQASRVKIYVNGVDESDTSNGGSGFSTANYPSQNATSGFNTTSQHEISTYDESDYHLDGYLAEVNFVDGTALTAASFGETKNGIWIPKDTSGLTFGTNGFHLTFKDDVVSEGFNTVTYAGNGGTQSISGIGFSPDLTWIKVRNEVNSHYLFDTIRGADQALFSDATNAETDYSSSGRMTSFDGDGFTVPSGSGSTGTNASGDTYVAWCWEAGGTPTADNSASAGATPTSGSVKIDGSNLGSALAGSIAATRLTANTTRGFSIVKYTGTGSNATLAHGLSGAPEMIFFKKDAATDWMVYNKTVGNNRFLYLNLTNAQTGTDSTYFNDADPTSTVINLGSYHRNNDSSATYIAYCWDSISGYSSIGTYSGSGSAGKSVTGLGFKPAFLMIKRTDTTGNWEVFDNMRNIDNDPVLYWNTTAAESAAAGRFTFDSDGFTLNDTGAGRNASGGTYIYMAFADTREAAFFKDVTSNGNHWTPVNLDYRDSVPDVPTNNFCTINPLDNVSSTYAEGNLQINQSGYQYNSRGTFGLRSGKWYWEIHMSSTHGEFGVCENGKAGQSDPQANIGFYFIYNNGSAGVSYKNATAGSQSTSSISMTNWSAGDICQIAYDADNGILYHGLNGTFQTSGDPAAGSGGLITGISPQFGGTMVPFFGSGTSSSRTWVVNFGQDSSFAGLKSTANSNADGEGHGSFAYAPPSGYLALCSQNLPDAAIIDGTDNFETLTYTGSGSSQGVTGLSFSPDWVWIKNRGRAGQGHVLHDTVRGNDGAEALLLQSDSTAAETHYDGYGVTTFDSGGFTVIGNGGLTNISSDTFVAWNWLAGTAFSNDASATSVGDTDSEGQVNTKAGFAIIKWTSGGSSVVAHGLGKKPDFIIIKSRDGTENWLVGNSATGFANRTKLNSTDAQGSSSAFSGGVTTTTFTENIASSSYDKIGYLFANTEGYCKTGSYVGNGNADGPFVYTGFRPSFLLVRRADGVSHWMIFDVARHPSNVNDLRLYPNLTNAEDSSYSVDLLSNGFKPRHTGSDFNTSGGTHIYLAFADQPFKFSNAR